VSAYQRKGYAEYCLGNYSDAFKSYNDGLKLDPSKSQLKEGADLSL